MLDIKNDFESILVEYIRSSEELADAADLCGDDPIKQDMIAFIEPQFIEMCARSEGVRAMVENSFLETRDFILEEMMEITKINLDIVRQIKNKIGDLEANDEFN